LHPSLTITSCYASRGTSTASFVPDTFSDLTPFPTLAFNAPHFADFVIEQPTPVVIDGKECRQIHHYSGPISMPAKNLLLAVED
jgi:hypothetical protein